jgi:cholesterol oxidase
MADGHWDAIVVGSGFGGSVLAYRLAEAGYCVCLLERGQAYPPNSFARSPIDMRNNFWDPSEGLYGLNNVWSFWGSAALVSSGLGGGSLIYANVLRRKDARWFEGWPITRQDLDPHYAAVERMMNVQQYPIHLPPFDRTSKATEFRQAAIRAGQEPIPLNLAVSFRVHPVEHPEHPDDVGNPPVVGEPIPGWNLHGKTRNTCRLCGECDIGCNYGSKNTLDFNYLSKAKQLGAEIRTLAQVDTIAPRADGKGYDVTYIAHDLENRGRKLSKQERLTRPRVSLSCDRLILAAGTMGTTFLLMSNRENLPNLSSALGTRYSTNGDDLAFFVNSEKELKPDFGPVITTGVRYPDTLDGGGDVGRGFYIEDGGNPYLFSWMAELSGVAGLIFRLVRFVWIRIKYLLGLSTTTDMGYQLARLIGSCTKSSRSMPVLGMGRDHPSGRFTLKGDVLDCDWNRRRSRHYYHGVTRELRKFARAMNARYLANPFSKLKPFEQVLTAHPLGGCPMGRNREEGVVDSWGEVFGHPGLYVADGSAMPGPVGVNPSLTIAAFADRVADGIINGKPGHPFFARIAAIFRFEKFFVQTLWDLFSAERQRVPKRLLKKGANAVGYPRPIDRFTLEGVPKDCDITTHAITTDDFLGLNIVRFQRKPCQDVVVLLHGLTTSTDMFIMPEHRNLASYLLDNGFTDVWSFDWRGSQRYSYDLFPTDFTMDDIALNDMPTAFSHIREVVGEGARIHVICHCVGSITFMMSLYAQKVKGIASVISNSVSLAITVPLWSRIKLTVAPWIFFRSPAVNPRWSYYPGLFTYGRTLSKLISLWHRLLGDCDVPACHMVSFMWGSGHPAVWSHRNISETTHQRTGDLFGAVNFTYYRHIRKMVSRGRAVKMYPNDPRYSSLPDEYLKDAAAIDTPVFFVAGENNHTFLDSNIRTFHVLNKLKSENRNRLRVRKNKIRRYTASFMSPYS